MIADLQTREQMRADYLATYGTPEVRRRVAAAMAGRAFPPTAAVDVEVATLLLGWLERRPLPQWLHLAQQVGVVPGFEEWLGGRDATG